eukprot:1121160-Amphidinium_carterae.2
MFPGTIGSDISHTVPLQLDLNVAHDPPQHLYTTGGLSSTRFELQPEMQPGRVGWHSSSALKLRSVDILLQPKNRKPDTHTSVTVAT